MSAPASQRTALVTGGAVRLGKAIAVGMAEAGYDVAISFRSSAEAAEETAAAIRALGRRCLAVHADLGVPEAPDALVDRVGAEYGRLDLVVNSAASFQTGELVEVDATAWDAVMAVNLRAPHLVVRAAAPLLAEARGSVVNLVDLSAFQPWSQYPHHSVSKAGLAHLTRVQARALAPRVRVNGVAPGAVLPPDDWPEERSDALAARAALQRVGAPDDVVGAVLYLAGADFVTGQIIAVDGGRLMGPSGPPGG